MHETVNIKLTKKSFFDPRQEQDILLERVQNDSDTPATRLLYKCKVRPLSVEEKSPQLAFCAAIWESQQLQTHQKGQTSH